MNKDVSRPGDSEREQGEDERKVRVRDPKVARLIKKRRKERYEKQQKMKTLPLNIHKRQTRYKLRRGLISNGDPYYNPFLAPPNVLSFRLFHTIATPPLHYVSEPLPRVKDQYSPHVSCTLKFSSRDEVLKF